MSGDEWIEYMAGWITWTLAIRNPWWMPSGIRLNWHGR